MNTLQRWLLLGVLAVGGCSSHPPPSAPTPGRYTPEAARAQAQRDFAAGRRKVCSAGGYVIYEPGLSEREKRMTAGWPRDGRMAGCTNPKVGWSVAFATAYNREMMGLVRERGRD